MVTADLKTIYRDYIACLNNQDWTNLGRFVQDDVRRNSEALGLAGYRRMLEDNFEQIPDLRFEMQIHMADPPLIAARLWFDVTPKAVTFAENVFYEFRDRRIQEVWSVIDKVAIEAQLR